MNLLIHQLIILATILLADARHCRSASSHLTHHEETNDIDSHSHSPNKAKSEPHIDVCKSPSVCVPYVSCPAHVRKTTVINCKTVGGGQGVCCSSGRNHTGNEIIIIELIDC